ncbi:hypothetical protein QYE76_049032 [Lolium multiflorum]|uniref:Uncharacterized protein n=1 Tax=Lolium multiflorum TaxID=4521 RepID=A0AAD8SPA3_LOLMU|nr:hypothetical protein QYE76_049032 [Lolium multiflorum]
MEPQSSLGILRSLRQLELSQMESARDLGPILSWIGDMQINLTRLIELDLSSNFLNGELPTSVFIIPTLERLYLQANQLAGSIQDLDVMSSHLVSVDLSTNELTGNIPNSFFQLKSLAYLDIGWNNFVGLVDLSSFWVLGNLVSLSLSNNNLSHGHGWRRQQLCVYLSPSSYRFRISKLQFNGISKLIGTH